MMRFFVLILLIISSGGCSAQNQDCVTLNKTIETLLKDTRVLNYLHPELKERIPYTFVTSLPCTAISSQYNVSALNDDEDDTAIKIVKFETLGEKIKISMFYPLEGVEINAEVNRDDHDYKIANLSFVEK